MGEPDIALKKYFSDKKRLADIFNYYCYDGREEIRPEELETKDRISNILISGKGKKKYPVERIRDVLAVAQRNGTVLLLLGIENQNAIDYGMPIRHMVYDALTYANQIEDKAKQKKKESGQTETTGSEFMSGFSKGDKLTPILTLVIYYGRKPWDGPRNLEDMLDMKCVPPEIQSYIQSQYALNLLEARTIRDYEKFHSDIREVFRILSCDDDRKKMRQIIEQDRNYHCLAHDAADAIATLTASNEIMNYSNKRKGEVDMCKAIQDMIEEGRQEGIQQGIQIFILDNMEENVAKERIQQKLQRRYQLSPERAEQYINQYAN